MTQDFYLLYNLESRIPHTISGTPITLVPDGMATCRVKFNLGEDFVLAKKSLFHYAVIVSKGYAEFHSKRKTSEYKRYAIPDGILEDLNYKMSFVSDLGIKYSIDNQQLTLDFDLANLTADQRNAFNTSITAKNGKYTVYVTHSRDPTALLEKFDIDLYKLSKIKQYSTALSVEEPVSIWTTKTR